MAKIGNWGSYIRFQTSDSRILNFDGFKRKSSVRVSKHNLIGKMPRLEFLGPDLQTVTFRMELNALNGVRPRKQEEKLLKWMNEGCVAPLVIGGKKICGQAMITAMSDAYNIVLKKGQVLSMTIDVTMTEYN
ncbi:MAG: phage tail protein [Lachnospiraceae bacterium]|jgi:phage protein U|nr:phage tail protein [Lachnospiraceae bacterium]